LGSESTTFEAVRQGETLWVYAVRDGQRQPLREVKWAFVDVEDGLEGMTVGVHAAKSTPDDDDDAGGEVEVHFSGFRLETSD